MESTLEPVLGIALTLPILLIGLVIIPLPLLTAVWAYGDAQRRGKSGCLVALLVFFLSWPLGLILWIVFRPEDPFRRRDDSYR